MTVGETLRLEMVEWLVNMNWEDCALIWSWPIVMHLPGGIKETARISDIQTPAAQNMKQLYRPLDRRMFH